MCFQSRWTLFHHHGPCEDQSKQVRDQVAGGKCFQFLGIFFFGEGSPCVGLVSGHAWTIAISNLPRSLLPPCSFQPFLSLVELPVTLLSACRIVALWRACTALASQPPMEPTREVLEALSPSQLTRLCSRGQALTITEGVLSTIYGLNKG